ncbi:MAG: Farnesyl pyrophosphate synthetase [Phylliscum demangeonii]|nr:MAG: Farnesyl pyrophosphate synthetase [Phylliscum demangeonii]
MPISRQDFESVFPQLVKDLTAHVSQYGTPSTALEWFQRNVEHNTMGGKYNRGMSVVDTASVLLGRALTPGDEDFVATATLGWCTELLQAFFLVSDDIMDGSATRRGQACWYRRPEVGMVAINDAFMLQSSIFLLLRRHFRPEPHYVDLLDLFHETSFQTELGQECDLLTAPEAHVDLARFDAATYRFIVVFKTAYYSFYLPVALALYHCRRATAANLAQARRILIPLGEYFQIQDDFLDAWGHPDTIGKIGTDIQDNKCSWLINQALLRADPDQRRVLDRNYGRKHADHVAAVKRVYVDLKLDEVYRAFEDEKVREIRRLIAELDESDGLKREIFDAFLAKIYKRDR